MKVVFDTNVLVAAFLSEGVCYKLLLRARKKEYELVLSPDIVAEFEGVLLRKFSLSQSELTDVRTLLAEATNQICLEVDPIEPVSRDPDDDKILACASVSQADYLVTGDEDLLVVRQYGGTKILAPRDFESLFAD
ncbi:MAG: putative toxin-antitoxin system toxin component, PIN family [Syntrophorhabdaceae bacterium]|nr:putative toxin-antitoxin system toxin component, PIN family [Syntrophorhabdaceae bacterium]